MTDPIIKRRPSDTVLHYLNTVLQIQQFSPGSRLPTTVQLAKKLGVSQGTVKNIYHRLAAEGKVDTRTGDGSYWLGVPEKKKRIYQIGINLKFETEESSFAHNRSRWVSRIYGGLLHGKLASSNAVQFHSCENLHVDSQGVIQNEFLGSQEPDGVLLLTLQQYPVQELWYNDRRIPSIVLNPYGEDATKNFVSPDYFSISYRLGEVWKKTRRKRILAFLSPAPEDSVSVRLRYGGLLCGFDAGDGRDAEVRCLIAPNGLESTGYEVFKQFLQEKDYRPDAVYAAGDLLALGAIKALGELGLRVPEDVSVVGGNGADPFKNAPQVLTCVEHGLEGLGEAMLRLLVRRIDEDGMDVPAHIEPSNFLIGTTTTTEENDIFKKVSKK